MTTFASAPRAAIGAFHLPRAIAIAEALANRTGVRAPLVTYGNELADPRKLGWYAPKSRIVNLLCTDVDLYDVLLHEFRHHLDNLENRGDSGRHPRAFWERLEELDDACADLRARFADFVY